MRYRNRVLLIFLFSGYILADDSWKVYDDTEIAIINITIDEEDLEWIYNGENVESDSLHLATIHFQNSYLDETIDSIGFRLRGNTSRVAAKKSFKVDFNHFISGRDFYGVEKLNLNGEHNDPSIVRSKLSWDIFQGIGMVSSRAAHTKLYINGEYFGLYISVEQIDDTFLSRNFDNDNGNLWKCLWPADLTYRGDDPEDYFPYYDDKRPYELKTNRDDYDYSKLARFIRVLNQTPDSLELVLDIKEAMQYFTINILSGGWDDYRFLRNNYYLYHDPSDDLIHWIPYDYDNTHSIDWFDIDWSTIDPYTYSVIDDDGRPLTEYLFSQDRYKNLLSHFLQFYVEQYFDLDSLGSDMNGHIDQLYSAVEEDAYRTMDYGFTIEDFSNSFGYDFQNSHVKQGIMEFYQNRKESLDEQIEFIPGPPIIYEAEKKPNIDILGDTVEISASIFGSPTYFHLFFLREGQTSWNSTPMIFDPDTLSHLIEDQDMWKGNFIPDSAGNYYWYLFATSEEGSERYPVYDFMEFEVINNVVSQPVIINEILAKNASINTDENGEFDDWVELWNYSDISVDLSSHFLTDKYDNLTKWQFPDSNVVLGAEGFLLIWCDEDQDQGSYHTNFKLSSSGEFLALVLPDGETILDSITFPAQSEDISFGRVVGNEDQWIFMSPSPADPNVSLELDDDITLPIKFKLKSIYPNPFNSSFQIDLFIEEPNTDIVTKLFSMTGAEVFSISFKGLNRGEISIPVKLNTPMASGSYFLEIESRGQVQYRKVLFLK